MSAELIRLLIAVAMLALLGAMWWRWRDHASAVQAAGYEGWLVFWACIAAEQLLLQQSFNAGIAPAWPAAAAALAAGGLLYTAWGLEAGRPSRWFWAAPIAAAALAVGPGVLAQVAPYAFGLLVAATLVQLGRKGTWPLLLLAATLVLWGWCELAGATGAVVTLAEVLPALAMLWALPERATALPNAATPEQVQLFRQSVRRSREFEILTHIGTALSSSLDADALLATIHTQLQKLMDVRNFYVAFQNLEQDEIQFAFEVEEGQRVPPRNRPRTNALTEHIIATGQPLMISGDSAAYIREHGLVHSGRVAKNYVGVPVLLQGKPCGVIAVQSHSRENAYDTEHLHVLEILASQAGVALDNARLFSEVQRDAGQKAFLNHIARLTISTLSPSEMMATVAREIAQAFHYDHIAVSLVRNSGEPNELAELETSAMAGAHDSSADAPQRVPIGLGLAGRAAQTGELQLLSAGAADGAGAMGWSRCVQAKSGLALPIRYAGTTLGVLHLESHVRFGFPADQVLVLQTLTDQMAVALNHATLFQQMQHQAITDSLTGLKTRRFFMEALQAEWRRASLASRTGEPAHFCVVLVDLDEFKALNDRFGHSEGDRVLVQAARLLEQKSRASSVVARYGGDEFTILVPACEPEFARLLPQRLQSALDDDPLMAKRNMHASFGLAIYPDSGATPEALLHHADSNMYRAKQLRQHRVAALGPTVV